jgi:hypothetical protein
MLVDTGHHSTGPLTTDPGVSMTAYSFSIRVDRPRNVLYIEQRGRPHASDFQRLKREFADAAAGLERGFAIVNDQRQLEPFDEPAVAVASELVQLADSLGVSRVIRIQPADLLSKTKLSRALVSGTSHYRTIRVATPEEAEAALEGS